MNSSGMKRGLAVSAISALAVAGVPFIASPASASDTALTVANVGPARDGGTRGAVVVFSVPQGKTPAEADLKLIQSSLAGNAGNQNNATQTVDIVPGSLVATADGSEKYGSKTATDEFSVRITVDTNPTGGTANFAAFIDDNPSNNQVDASELRTPVSITTAGAPTQISVSPTLQSSPVNVPSGKYTATLKDASGNTTQLSGTETVGLTNPSGPTGGVLTTAPGLGANAFGTAAFDEGSATFTASGSKEGLYGIALTGNGADISSASGSASLDVNGTVAAGITPQEVDVVTGADTRAGFGKASTSVDVRPDQSTVTFNVKSPSNAGKVVTLTATSAAAPHAVTFGGKTSTSVTVTLDADGIGSIAVPVDASSIQDGDSFTTSGSGVNFTVNYASPDVDSVDGDSTVYLTAFKGTTTPTVTVLDQYGNPVSGTYVTYTITAGPNAGAESDRVAVDANGKATFSITDTKATAANNTDSLLFKVYAGKFDATALTSDAGSSIKYSTDGTGADFLLTVDGQIPGGAAYNPVIQPLTDTVADNTVVDVAAPLGVHDNPNTEDSGDETAKLNVNGGTTGATVTVTADNGGKVLTTGTTLAQAKETATGTSATDFYIVGTKAGVVNVTVTSGGKTKTATVTVKTLSQSTAAADLTQAPQTARNIAIEGPDAVVAGNVVEYTVTITDAFGNPVKGFDPANINTLLTGPAAIKGNSGKSDAAGEIVYSVELAQDARNPISFKVTGTTADFGAAKDRLTAASTTDDGKGLSASMNTDTADATVTNIDDLEQAVADAQAAVDAAQADVTAAQADLDVATTEQSVAQTNVDELTAKKQRLRDKLNLAKDKGNKQKAKTTRKKLRQTKRDLRDAQDTLTIATAKVAGAQSVLDAKQDILEQAQADLAEAQANLEAAQGDTQG